MADKKKTVQEALKLLNELISKGAAGLVSLKRKIGKGWLTQGMYDSQVQAYKKDKRTWYTAYKSVKAGYRTPKSIFSDFGKKDIKKKEKSHLSWADIAKGKGSRSEQMDWKNERLRRIQEENKKKEEEEK